MSGGNGTATGYGRTTKRSVPTHDRQPQTFGGLWEGHVVDVKDPEKRGRVKVRIFDIHGEDAALEVLPWADPNWPSAFTHQDKDNDQTRWRNGGFFHVPPVDSLVNIMFRHSDPNRPVWIGGWHPFDPSIVGREQYGNKQPRDALYNADGVPSCPTWGSIRGFRIEFDDEASEMRLTTPGGHKITMSDVEGELNDHGDCIRLEDRKGNFIYMHTAENKLKIRWDGDVEEHITGNVSRIIEGSLSEKVTGKVSRTYEDEYHLKVTGIGHFDAQIINLNGGLSQPEAPVAVQQGTEAGGDRINGALEALGSVIRRVFVGKQNG